MISGTYNLDFGDEFLHPHVWRLISRQIQFKAQPPSFASNQRPSKLPNQSNYSEALCQQPEERDPEEVIFCTPFN